MAKGVKKNCVFYCKTLYPSQRADTGINLRWGAFTFLEVDRFQNGPLYPPLPSPPPPAGYQWCATSRKHSTVHKHLSKMNNQTQGQGQSGVESYGFGRAWSAHFLSASPQSMAAQLKLAPICRWGANFSLLFLINQDNKKPPPIKWCLTSEGGSLKTIF